MKTLLPYISFLFIAACGNPPGKMENKDGSRQTADRSATFLQDRSFLNKHIAVLVLQKDSMRVLIAPAFQARVMTSSSGGDNGKSYGWINYALMDSGKYLPHINAYGGEERLWMGPEGGQFSVFFKKGQAFEFKNWQTPAIMDTAAYELVNSSPGLASFSKTFDLVNYSGTVFHVTAHREIKLLTAGEASGILGIPLKGVKWVGYQTTNSLVNKGREDWNFRTGVLSIWMLSMIKSSAGSTIIIPYRKGLGAWVNDAYFGKTPAGRLHKEDSVLFFKADSKYRSKIGLPPAIVRSLAGSYDAASNMLSIIQFDYKGDTAYVNSKWELQQSPYKGDVVNAYNDGPNETGGRLGSFYELETSSPAVALKKDQTLTHTQRIFHFEGAKEQLNNIAKQLLGADLDKL